MTETPKIAASEMTIRRSEVLELDAMAQSCEQTFPDLAIDGHVFATMFVYDQFNIPIWYVATMNSVGSNFTWTGDLLVTSGPGSGRCHSIRTR